jgi:Ca2+-binding EF-hand superfamily protein
VEKDSFLPFEVEQALAKLVGRELKLARDNESLKQELETRYDYNTGVLYHEVDDINYGFVDQNNLKRFLIKNGIAAKEKLLLAIIRRYDLDADAKLNKEEFISGIKS